MCWAVGCDVTPVRTASHGCNATPVGAALPTAPQGVTPLEVHPNAAGNIVDPFGPARAPSDIVGQTPGGARPLMS